MAVAWLRGGVKGAGGGYGRVAIAWLRGGMYLDTDMELGPRTFSAVRGVHVPIPLYCGSFVAAAAVLAVVQVTVAIVSGDGVRRAVPKVIVR